MKFFLISLVVLVVVLLVERYMVKALSDDEIVKIKYDIEYPTRLVVWGWVKILSIVETLVSLVIWIINM